MTLTETIEKIIEQSYTDTKVDVEYQTTFSNEGQRKATYIIDDLRYKESKGLLQIDKLCYLSIGGADGSEAEKILTDTNIQTAILLEISDEGAEKARERSATLKTSGKDLIVIQGDAYSRLEDALSVVEKLVLNNKTSGLIVSAQAVLHELPWRSSGYNQDVFLGKLYRDPKLEYCLFYSREPCIPREWPNHVKIRIETVSNEDLYRLVCLIRDRLKIIGNPQKLATNWLYTEAILAIESLHKLLRNNTLKRIEYEMGEQLTGFDPIDVKRSLENSVEGMKVNIDYIITLGFRRALEDNKVDYVGGNSEVLPLPKTHVEIIGFKTKKGTPIDQMPPDEDGPIIDNDPPDTKPPIKDKTSVDDKELEKSGDITKLPANFHNPFAGEISEGQILDWVSQFQKEEIPIVIKLIENFRFISYQQIANHCQILYNKITSFYKDDAENFLFVQSGDAAKSSGIITYYFRTANEIPSDKFIWHEKLSQINLESKILIFIDDLLASGHQALNDLSKITSQLKNRVCLAILVACEQGLELLREKLDIDIISSIEIKRSDNIFNEDNTLFADQTDKQKLRKILIKYGEKLNYSNPFGYANLSLLLAFPYTTPDNTIAMFWAKGRFFQPLLRSAGPGRNDLLNAED